MATRTLTERLNHVADEVEKKLKDKDKTPKGKTATDALERVENAVKKL